MIYIGIGMLPVRDELWMYYKAYDRLRDQGKEAEYHPAIGRVRLRRDGLVSQDASGQESVLTTIPFTLAGRRLEVNLDGSSRGWLQVEILDEQSRALPGFGRQDADRLAGNDIRRKVT